MKKLAATAAFLFVFYLGSVHCHAYVKWFEFNPTCAAMTKALDFYLEERGNNADLDWDWISLLAYAGAKGYGDFNKNSDKHIRDCFNKLKAGESLKSSTEGLDYFKFYDEVYRAVLGNFVGEYIKQDKNGDWIPNFGLKAYSPIASGFYYGHVDDFGASRNFGYARKHQGHDLMGSQGTPVIAVESGVVETLGWNYYGGWRIGIRSFDGKRYYYYAHLKKGRPYTSELSEGLAVKAGDVIGYMGMTGYSRKEDAENVKPPHLHYGMQIIFDESQKDGNNQIWIDMYELTKFLERNRSSVIKDEVTKDQRRKYDFFEPDMLQ